MSGRPVRLSRYGTWQLSDVRYGTHVLDVVEILGHWIHPDLRNGAPLAVRERVESYRLRLVAPSGTTFDTTVNIYGDFGHWWMTPPIT